MGVPEITQINILTVMKLYFQIHLQILLHGDSRWVQQMPGFVNSMVINLAKGKK
jgi:hypothetical protein